MKSTIPSYAKIAYALVVGMVFGHGQPALAGWNGGMNGIGFGQASVNVRAFETSANKTKTVTTTNMQNPSVAMTITSGYVFGGTLPPDSSPATVAKVKGSSGYIWQASTVGSNGDSTDNAELEGRVRITAADCASLSMESSSVIDPNTKTGTITINVHGTAGTAYWTRGFELLNGQVPPEDDPNTPENEFIEFLKANGDLKWDVLNVGPMNQDTTNCSAINIPFSYETDITNLYFLSDGVAKSLPLVIECPNDIVVNCTQPVTYPETVLVGGCGNITVTFDPPAPAGGTFPAGSFPVGTTPVTVTAADKDGNTTNCTFNVVVTDTVAPVAPVLATVTGSCGTPVTLTAPTATDNCAGTVIGTTTNSLVYNTAGTNTVYWTFNDGNGNVSTATQTVIMTGLAFTGYYSPIGGTGGTCASPLRTAKLGNNLPVKFDISCGGSPVTTGTPPTLSIEKSNAQCTSLTDAGGGNFTLVGNEWHFNWNTGSGGVTAGTYKLTASLQDGSKHFVWVKLK